MRFHSTEVRRGCFLRDSKTKSFWKAQNARVRAEESIGCESRPNDVFGKPRPRHQPEVGFQPADLNLERSHVTLLVTLQIEKI